MTSSRHRPPLVSHSEAFQSGTCKCVCHGIWQHIQSVMNIGVSSSSTHPLTHPLTIVTPVRCGWSLRTAISSKRRQQARTGCACPRATCGHRPAQVCYDAIYATVVRVVLSQCALCHTTNINYTSICDHVISSCRTGGPWIAVAASPTPHPPIVRCTVQPWQRDVLMLVWPSCIHA